MIKDMKDMCEGAQFACDLQVQFDSTGGSDLETTQEEIDKWIEKVKKIL